MGSPIYIYKMASFWVTRGPEERDEVYLLDWWYNEYDIELSNDLCIFCVMYLILL